MWEGIPNYKGKFYYPLKENEISIVVIPAKITRQLL